MPRQRIDTLADIETAVWQELTRAPRDKHHEWRTPVLATVQAGEAGPQADARTVVLREVDRETRTLLLFTDARSPKVAQMAAHPQGTVVMWSKNLGWQLRIGVQLRVETEGLAVLSRWARLKLSPAAQDYMAPSPPGSELPVEMPAAAQDPLFLSTAFTNPQVPRESREHFAVIAASVQSIDWLELSGQGHRRADFSAGTSRWLVP